MAAGLQQETESRDDLKQRTVSYIVLGFRRDTESIRSAL